ncbi:MAG: hypothetical protein WDW36_006327 [Sanguina aurantia]
MAGSFAGGYVGTSEDVARIRRQEKQRGDARKKFESLKKESEDRVDGAGLRQFGVSTTEALEHAFKNETVGLVTKAEFVQKRTTLQERIEEEMRRKVRALEAAALREKERRRREKGGSRPRLSFTEEEGEEEADEGGSSAAQHTAPTLPPGFLAAAAAAAAANGSSSAADPTASDASADESPAAAAAGPSKPAATSDPAGSRCAALDPAQEAGGGGPLAKRAKFGKLGKDPSVKTSFLPDKQREQQEEELRSTLRKEWQAGQDRAKAEPLEITYSYWDGAGHRRSIVVPKGATIGAFLKGVRDQLAPEFRELRSASVDNLIYVKEDLIMPHHHTFHDLIINKARGKSGPLFDFTVREDVRVVNDATKEKTDSHAGKIVERHWYDKNKHIFPASRWEIFDVEKSYDNYTTHGDEVNAK